MTESDFGKGCVYCLGLYLAHAYMLQNMRDNSSFKTGASTWFNAASDHLYELTAPIQFSQKLQKRILDFKTHALSIGHGERMMDETVTWVDVDKSIDEAKKLLFLIDKQLNINPVEAKWK